MNFDIAHGLACRPRAVMVLESNFCLVKFVLLAVIILQNNNTTTINNNNNNNNNIIIIIIVQEHFSQAHPLICFLPIHCKSLSLMD
jgi:hypothetical protein